MSPIDRRTDYRRSLAACVRLADTGTFVLMQRAGGEYYARLFIGAQQVIGTGRTVGAAVTALHEHARAVMRERRRLGFGRLAELVPKPGAVPADVHRAAAALGKRGGAKGGKARAAALSPRRRKAIARKAARSRWGKRP